MNENQREKIKKYLEDVLSTVETKERKDEVFNYLMTAYIMNSDENIRMIIDMYLTKLNGIEVK